MPHSNEQVILLTFLLKNWSTRQYIKMTFEGHFERSGCLYKDVIASLICDYLGNNQAINLFIASRQAVLQQGDEIYYMFSEK